VIRRFNRFELKYVLHVERCAKIMDELEHQIPPDQHGGERGYPIVSLYYDSPQLDCFWAKIEGIRFRRKVRLRIYPGDDISQVSRGAIEIKQRINKTVQKRRLELPLDQAERLCEGRLSFEGLDEMDTQVAHEVTYLSRSLQLQPSAITAYWRRAFEGQEENAGVRVTFDTLVAARIHALTVNAPANNRLILPADHCIMEVKVDDRVPEWVTSLLARHDCQLSRVSKYCAGVATLRGLKVMPLAMSPGVPAALEPGEGDASNGSGRSPWLASAAEPSAARTPSSPAPPRLGPPSSEPPHG
jgi:SPX domain protein involved in polyphosphate accumulation